MVNLIGIDEHIAEMCKVYRPYGVKGGIPKIFRRGYREGMTQSVKTPKKLFLALI